MKKVFMIAAMLILIGICPAYAENAVTFSETATGVICTINDTNGSFGRAMYTILKNGASYNSAGDYDVSDLLYADAFNVLAAGESFAYDFKDYGADYGAYSMRVSINAYDGTVGNYDYTYYYNSETDHADCVRKFKEVSDYSNFLRLFALYGETKHVININDIEPDDVKKPSCFLLYTYLREIYINDKEYGYSMTDVTDVQDLLKASILADDLLNGTGEKEELFIKYCSSYKSLIPEKTEYSKLYAVVQSVKDKITDAASAKKYFSRSAAAALMYKGTVQDIADVIENYADRFEIDKSYAQKNGVSILSVATKMHLDLDARIGEYVSDIGNIFVSLVDEIKAENTPAVNPVSPGGGGGGRGSSGSGISGAISNNGSVPSVTPDADTDKIFADLNGFDWAKEHIEFCYKKGIVSGNGDGNFEPQKNVTREQFVKMVVEAFDVKKISDSEMNFADVTSNDWFYPYLYIGYNSGIISGVSESNFGVGNYITRQDMAVILYRANWLASKDGFDGFADDESIDDYAKNAVNAFASNGVIGGYDDATFRPQEYATRAEAAVILGRLLNKGV